MATLLAMTQVPPYFYLMAPMGMVLQAAAFTLEELKQQTPLRDSITEMALSGFKDRSYLELIAPLTGADPSPHRFGAGWPWRSAAEL